ncbi:hypothetical protein C0431_08055 [bacterium]|jgi:uncharacterized membrane protein YgcG|nr:hypothetical protein [bacterium]
MQPPQAPGYTPMNAPQPPRGRFDWAVFSESTDLIKTNTLNFVLVALLGWVAAYVLQQIFAIPQVFASLSSQNQSASIAMSMIFSTLGQIVFISIYSVMQAGLMKLGQTAASRQIPDISEAFKVFPKFFNLSLAGLAPWVIYLPISIVIGLIFGVSVMDTFSQTNPSFENMMGLIAGAGVVYLISLIILVLSFPLFILAIPALVIKEISIGDAIRESVNLGKAHYLSLLMYSIVSGLVTFAAMMCCCVPVLIATPWLTVALLLVYRDLSMTPITKEGLIAGGSIYPREYGAQMPGNFVAPNPGTSYDPMNPHLGYPHNSHQFSSDSSSQNQEPDRPNVPPQEPAPIEPDRPAFDNPPAPDSPSSFDPSPSDSSPADYGSFDSGSSDSGGGGGDGGGGGGSD